MEVKVLHPPARESAGGTARVSHRAIKSGGGAGKALADEQEADIQLPSAATPFVPLPAGPQRTRQSTVRGLC